MDASITLNGEPLKTALKKLPLTEAFKVRNEIVRERKTLNHIGLGRNNQSYNTRPGEIRIMSTETMLDYQADIKRLNDDLQAEAAVDKPNMNKIILGLLVNDQFLGVKEIHERLSGLVRGEVKQNVPSAAMAWFRNPKYNRPIAKIILAADGDRGRKVFRIPPAYSRIGLHRLHELSKVKGQGSYSIRQMHSEFPDLKAPEPNGSNAIAPATPSATTSIPTPPPGTNIQIPSRITVDINISLNLNWKGVFKD